VSSENQRSTRFSHELDVGVKCRTKRGWASSQRWISGSERFKDRSMVGAVVVVILVVVFAGLWLD
jgi:hypothetical protein